MIIGTAFVTHDRQQRTEMIELYIDEKWSTLTNIVYPSCKYFSKFIFTLISKQYYILHFYSFCILVSMSYGTHVVSSTQASQNGNKNKDHRMLHLLKYPNHRETL
ncbi:hypothetical protein V8G54_012382 [Vigna mungo]|uniref:Uncharacterized protein n=1 Tax=Vigna mungo TaxID=3915 RepID=A0AAQ3NR47_VIGMU